MTSVLSARVSRQSQLNKSTSMTLNAGHQGVDVSTIDDTNVSAQTRTPSRETGSDMTTKALGGDVSKKDSDEGKLSMEKALETSSEATVTATSSTQDTGSEYSNTDKKRNGLCNVTADDGTKRTSDISRPRTDSNLSRGSSEVNWEELQKTENEHVQEEGSDEVSY